MASIKAFISVRDRAKCTYNLVQSLRYTAGDKVDIFIYDNYSSDESLQTLIKLYYDWLREGVVASVTLNRPNGMPENCYWSKNHSWRLFLEAMRLLPEEEREFLIMLDNDVEARPGWLEDCLAVLEDPRTIEGDKEMGITYPVVSPYDGPPAYENDGELTIGGVDCWTRDSLTSRFWVARSEWWLNQPAPTWEQIERMGKPDRMPTDAWYKGQMLERREHFLVLKEPKACDPKEPFGSARFHYRIGADVEAGGHASVMEAPQEEGE